MKIRWFKKTNPLSGHFPDNKIRVSFFNDEGHFIGVLDKPDKIDDFENYDQYLKECGVYDEKVKELNARIAIASIYNLPKLFFNLIFGVFNIFKKKEKGFTIGNKTLSFLSSQFDLVEVDKKLFILMEKDEFLEMLDSIKTHGAGDRSLNSKIEIMEYILK